MSADKLIMPVKDSNKRSWYFDLALLIAGIALLFGLFLGDPSLNVPDEARYSEIPREMLVLHDFVTPHLNGIKYFEKPPLFYWLQATSIRWFNPWIAEKESATPTMSLQKNFSEKFISEWVVRLPNALVALLGCLLLYAAGRLLFNRRTGLLSAIILATSLLYFALARMVTLDMSLSVFLSGCLLSFLVAVHVPLSYRRRFLLYMAYSLSALAVLTKGLIGIVFPAMIIGSWIALTKQWRILRELYLPSGLLLFLLLVLPWHILVQVRNPEFFKFYFIDQQFLRYSTLIAHRYKPGWFFIPILFAGFLPWVLFFISAITTYFSTKWQSLKEKNRHLFLLLWISLIFIFFSFSRSKLIPYILPIFPAMALLTGHYLADYWKDSKAIRWSYRALPFLWLSLGGLGILWLQIDASLSIPRLAIPWLIAGYIIFLLSSIMAAFYSKWNKSTSAFVLLALGSAITFVVFSMSVPYLETYSVKPLIIILKPLLYSHDKVVSYNQYYQDLPFYLRQRVIIVNSQGELSFGLQHQEDAKAWMLSEANFWPLWNGSQRIYMITNKESYQHLKQEKKLVYGIAATASDVLLTNHRLPTQNIQKDRKQ